MNVKYWKRKAVGLMGSRGGLGLVPGNQVGRAIYSHSRRLVKKPCRSVSGSTFLPMRGLRFLEAGETPPTPPVKLYPLYLFHCGVPWHQPPATESGWGVVPAMLSRERKNGGEGKR